MRGEVTMLYSANMFELTQKQAKLRLRDDQDNIESLVWPPLLSSCTQSLPHHIVWPVQIDLAWEHSTQTIQILFKLSQTRWWDWMTEVIKEHFCRWHKWMISSMFGRVAEALPPASRLVGWPKLVIFFFKCSIWPPWRYKSGTALSSKK